MPSVWNNGMLEYWPPVRSAFGSERILGIKTETTYLNCKNSFKPIIPLLHYSIIPLFQLGEAPKFYLILSSSDKPAVLPWF